LEGMGRVRLRLTYRKQMENSHIRLKVPRFRESDRLKDGLTLVMTKMLSFTYRGKTP